MRASFERLDGQGSSIDVDEGADFIARALLEGEAVHRELRPDMPTEYLAFVQVLFAEGTVLTQLVDAGEVKAIAVWRAFTTTYCGLRLEIDDLVTANRHRSQRHGATLLRALERRAAAMGCPSLTLNSAVQRADAHRFYFRERYHVVGFHFSKAFGA